LSKRQIYREAIALREPSLRQSPIALASE